MTLHVTSLDQFVDAVRRVLGHRNVYLADCQGETLLTAVAENGHQTVQYMHPKNEKQTKNDLSKFDVMIHPGRWSDSQEPEQNDPGVTIPYVAVVTYKSGEGKPSVWVDAYDAPPSSTQVLQSIYDEFRKTGELADFALDQFLKLAEPRVTIVTPRELESYVATNRAED